MSFVLDTNENHVLENSKVKLEVLGLQHIDALAHFAITEPEIWKYSLMSVVGAEGMKSYIEYAVGQCQRQEALPFIVWDKINETYVGSTRYYDIQRSHNCITIGYTWYGSKYQGTHVNKNSKLLLLQYAFETLSVDRVEFRADHKNVRSLAAMQSIGCRLEGVLRSNCGTPDGHRRDSAVLSILKSEWYGKVKENLEIKIAESS
jgi:N-acetyltransferase